MRRVLAPRVTSAEEENAGSGAQAGEEDHEQRQPRDADDQQQSDPEGRAEHLEKREG